MPTPPPNWRREAAEGLKAHWLLKAAAIPGFMAVFFAGYFLTLKFPHFPVLTMPLTAVDRAIGFHPGAAALYVSLWIYVVIPPALMRGKSELVFFGAAAGALALAGLAIFFVWPTAVPDPGIDWSQSSGIGRLKTIDASGNACPSLHVAFAVFSAVWIGRMLRRLGAAGPLRCLSWCWCAGILYSTLATKQHVALDVLAGAPLGLLFALARPSGTA